MENLESGSEEDSPDVEEVERVFRELSCELSLLEKNRDPSTYPCKLLKFLLI